MAATDREALLTESATALHFYTLLDGLMAIGHSAVLELPANVVHKVFRALEFGLLGDEVMNASGLCCPPQHIPSHSTNAFHTQRPRIPQIQLGNPLAALASHSSSFAGPTASAITTKGSTLKRDKGKVNHDRESVHPEAKSVNLDAIFEVRLRGHSSHAQCVCRQLL